MAPSGPVASDELPCCYTGPMGGCARQPSVVSGRKDNDFPGFQWINTVRAVI
jgi:hypothetical protein